MARNLFGADKASVAPSPSSGGGSGAGGRGGKKRKRRKPSGNAKPKAQRSAKKPLQGAPVVTKDISPSALPAARHEGVGALQGPARPPLMAVDVAALHRRCPRLDEADLAALRAKASREMEADPHTPASWIDPWCSDPTGTNTLYSGFDRTWSPNAYFRPSAEQRNALRRHTIRNLIRYIDPDQWQWNLRYTSPAFTFWQYHVRYARQHFFDDSLRGEAHLDMCQKTFGYICKEWFEFPWETNQGELLFDEEKVPKPFKRFMEAMELEGRWWRYAVMDAAAEQRLRLCVDPNPNPYEQRTVLWDYTPQIVDRSKPIDATNITWGPPPEPLTADPHLILRKQKRKNDPLTLRALRRYIHDFMLRQGPLALRLLHWLGQQTPRGADTHKQRRTAGHQGFKGRFEELVAQAHVPMEVLQDFAYPAHIAWPRDTDFKNPDIDFNKTGWRHLQHRNLPPDWETRTPQEQNLTQIDCVLGWHHTRWADVVDPELLAWSAQHSADTPNQDLLLSLFLFLVDMSRKEWDNVHLDDKAALWIEHTRPAHMDGGDPVLDAELDPYDPRFQGMDEYEHDLHPDLVVKDYSVENGLRAFLATHPYNQELADRIHLVQDVADAMHRFDEAKEGQGDIEAAEAIRQHVEAALPWLSTDAEGLLRTARYVRFVTHPEMD